MRIPLPRLVTAFLASVLYVTLLAALAAGETANGQSAPTYATEEEWIVDSVARDILSYAAYASLGSGAATVRWEAPTLQVSTEGPAFQLSWKLKPAAEAKTAKLEVPVCVWLPETYASWTAQLLPARAPQKAAPGPKSTAASTLLETLLTPSAAVQQKENLRLSQWLAREPMNPDAHEEAALLLASLGISESAGSWTDRRRIISRVTAHLALASSLRGAGERTNPGRVAEIWLHLTLQRKLEVNGMLAALPPRGSRAVQAWLNTLDLMNAYDWRKCKDPAHASLLEQTAFVEALAHNTSVGNALRFVALQPQIASTQGVIRSLLARNLRPSTGHVVADHALDLEVAEIRMLSGGGREAAQTAAWLNLPVAEPVAPNGTGHAAVTVIDPGMWASFSQRHLLCTIAQLTRYYQASGDEAGREELSRTTEPLVRTLTLAPALRRYASSEQSEYAGAMRELGAVSRDHPELLGPSLWETAAAAPKKPFQLVNTMADPNEWFKPPAPRGCAQFSGARLSFAAAKNVAWVESQYALNPYENNLALELLKLRNEDLPAALKTVGTLNEYAVPVMRAIADLMRSNPTAYRAQMDRICQLDPAAYMTLGRYLAEHGQPEDALLAYEKEVKVAPDFFDLSNELGWLVNYYFEHGRKQEALSLATKAAAAETSYGIPTLAWLYEQMGDVDKAYQIFKTLSEYIGIDQFMIAFCGRHRSDPKHPEFARIYEEAFQQYFPKGNAATMTPETIKGRLTKFALVPDDVPLPLAKAGLRAKAEIVALDGMRVASISGLKFLRNSSPNKVMTIIFYQDGKYQQAQLEAKPPLLTDFMN